MDNASAHSAKATCDFLMKMGIKTLEHPPYSPDLAPADFFLFPTLKTELAGTRIIDHTVQKEWERVAKTLDKDDFTKAFMKWEERWGNCIEVGGDYVEKCQ